MLTAMDGKRIDHPTTESKREEAEEFMTMLKDMDDGEVKTIKGIMLGIKLSRASA